MGLFLAMAVFATAADLSVSGWALKPGSTAKASGLRLEAAVEGSEATLASAPVTLNVGELYRLSATIRTEGVKADPLARYPTALGACLSMESFPFTNASQSVGGTSERQVSLLFLATSPTDRVQLHLGRNGWAAGSALFRNVKLEKVEDITAFIPMETVRWAGKGFRYEMGGWTFLHIEGAPYARGRQHGELMADEIVRYMTKLGVLKNAADPARGWADQRQMADALFFRKYDVEFLEEMKGIADGAAKAGVSFKGRVIDLLDIVTLNSAVDMGALQEGLTHAPHPLTGRTFMTGDDELEQGGKGDHCNSFVATKGATRSGRFIFTQMFMWNGYTGTEWNVMLDIVPEQGHRLVLQTFAGGIHSGTDGYLNASGLVMGETTVGQTPFSADGTPQSNRIRKAAQNASGIDEAAAILSRQNNGLYTNDWTMADTKTDEGACCLLGTEKARLWRTGTLDRPADTPGRHQDFIWANNNRDPRGARRVPRESRERAGRPGLQYLEPRHRLAGGLPRLRPEGLRHRHRHAGDGHQPHQPPPCLQCQAHHRGDGREAGLHRPPGQDHAEREAGGWPLDRRPARRHAASESRLHDLQPHLGDWEAPGGQGGLERGQAGEGRALAGPRPGQGGL